MRTIIKIAVMTLLAVGLGQCGSGDEQGNLAASATCVPASVRRCAGPLSCKGDQVCAVDGTWSSCVCDPTVPNAGHDAGGDDASSTDAGGVDVPTAPTVRYVLLDDMEGTAFANGPIPFAGTEVGTTPGFWSSWRSFGDPSNSMSPEPYAHTALPTPHPTLDGVTSAHAAHLACRVADVYGYCEQGFWLAQSSPTSDGKAGPASPDGSGGNMSSRVPVDLGAYQGLVFWAMSNKPTRLKVVVEDAETDALGGRCGRADASADQCGDAFSRQISLTDSWRRYEVKFSELSQDGWGHAAPSGRLDPHTIYLIGFQIDGPQSSSAAPVEAEFWIDDLYLVQPVQPVATPDGGTPPDGRGLDGAAGRCLGGADELIADFQDDSRLNPADGRKGSFSVNGDSKGTFVPARSDNGAYPIDPDHGNDQCSGAGSFHTKAVGFADWGAAIAADLLSKSGGAKGTYDASKYRGVSFWAKASAPIAGVKVSFPDIFTDGGADPKSLDPKLTPCVFESGSKYNCSPYLVKLGDSDFPSYKTYQIDTAWKRFDILFADTQQDFFNPGFHTAEDRLDTKHLTSITIQIGTLYVNGSATPNDFELWIDDVYFIK